MTRVVSVIFLILLLAGKAGAAGVTFCGVGDVMLGREVGKTIQQKGAHYPFEQIAALIGQCDLAFLNLECPLTETGEPLSKRFVFKGVPSSAKGLAKAGFKIASVANNHTLDQGRDAFLETMETLRKNGLYPVGGGSNQHEARQPIILNAGGLRFAFLAFLDMLPDGLAYLEDRPGPAYASIAEIEQAVSAARKEADVVIVSFHWGAERSSVPTMNQIEYAHRVIDAGADLVIGHHPHVLQSVELYHGKPIVYSLGNFVFDNHDLPQRQSMIFGCTFEKGKVSNLHAIPVIIEGDRPRPASREEAKEIFESIRTAPAGFNIQFDMENTTILMKAGKESADPSSPHLLKREEQGKTILVSSESIVLSAADGFVLDRFEPGENGLMIKAAELIDDSDMSRLYVILGPPGSKEGGRIGILPVDFSRGKLSRFYIDSHSHLNPWKLMKCDVDGDSRPELCVGTWKTTRYDPVYDNRLFVYERRGNSLYPKWLGSKLMHSFIDFSFKDIDGDGVEELITQERMDDGTIREMAYTWRMFGFSAYKDTGESAALSGSRSVLSR